MELASLFDRFVAERVHMNLSGEAFPIAFQTHLISYSGQKLRLLNSIPLKYLSEVLTSSHFSLSSGSVVLKGVEIHPIGSDLLFLVKEVENWDQKRSAQRKSLEDQEDLWVSFLNPLDKVTIIQKKIIDISGGGMSLKLNRRSSLFVKDRVLEGIQFPSQDGSQGELKTARVVYVKLVINVKGEEFFQAGLQFLSSS